MQKEKKESNIKCEKKLENVGLKLEFWLPFILVLGLTTTPTIFLPFLWPPLVPTIFFFPF